MNNIIAKKFIVALFILITASQVNANKKNDAVLKRGEYLVTITGCSDCHTPGYFLGKVDMSRYLGGSDVGFQTPEGTFVGPNLTSDKKTGLGEWSKKDIIQVLQTGVRPDGRILSMTMPWKAFAHLTKADADAIASYLISLKPIENSILQPISAVDNSKIPVLKVIMP